MPTPTVDRVRSRDDSEVVCHERAFFFESGGRRLFGVLHAPLDPPTPATGIVICDPLESEKENAQRTQVLLARRLSALGVHVMRFDYAGYGDSDAEMEAASLSTQLGDIRAATDELAEQTGVERLGLMGLRLGGTLAALTAEQDPRIEILVLWAPALQPGRLIDQLMRRTALANSMLSREPRTRRQLIDAMEQEGYVDLGGDVLSRQAYEDYAGIDLVSIAWRRLGDVLIADVTSEGQAEDHRLGELGERLGAVGNRVDVYKIEDQAIWTKDNLYSSSFPRHLVEATASWVVEKADTADVTERAHVGAAGWRRDAGQNEPAADGPPDTHRSGKVAQGTAVASGTGGETEQPVRFTSGGVPLSGILHRPAGPLLGAVVFVNAGLKYRVGPYRIYVRMARRLASAGFASLRFDLPGVGNSEGELGDVQYDVHDPRHTSDAVAYVMEAVGTDAVALLGLCSGSRNAVRAAASDPRIRSLLALSMPVEYVDPNSATARHHEQIHGRAPKASAAVSRSRMLGYVRRAVHPRSWWRALTLSSDFAQLGRVVRDFVKGLVAGADDRPRGGGPISSACASYFESGRPALFVYGAQDRVLIRDFQDHVGSMFESAEQRPFEFRVVDGATHTFSSRASQEALTAVILDWLQR